LTPKILVRLVILVILVRLVILLY